MATSGRNIVRIQLDLPEDKVKDLDELMKDTHITTRKDLFNTALTLLNWVVDERKEDRIIASLDKEDDTYKELVMPFFSVLRKRKTAGQLKAASTEAG